MQGHVGGDGETRAQLGEGAAIQVPTSAGYRYADALIAVTILPGGEGFHLDVTNLSDHPMRLLWNEAAFLGADGSVDPVIRHLGPYPALSPYQSPSVIQPESVIHAAVEPERGVRFVAGQAGSDWVHKPTVVVVRTGAGGKSLGHLAEADDAGGGRLGLLLTFEAEGTR